MGNRSFYSASFDAFFQEDADSILAKMVKKNPFDLNDLQRNAWIEEIKILKRELSCFKDGYIMLEYTIPRMGKRVDAVIIYAGIIFLLEFKVGDSQYQTRTDNQVLDYALDLKNFHHDSRDRIIVPISIPTQACSVAAQEKIKIYSDRVCYPIRTSEHQIGALIETICNKWSCKPLEGVSWEAAEYMPTPTIIEAARALYNNHTVKDIVRSDAGAQNLTNTTDAIKNIINSSKVSKKKSIIFITGVPGSGKTLVGLNLASQFHNNDIGEHAVFLTGNLPLVAVLQAALANDKVQREREKGHQLSKNNALREVKSFIQIIHHYRDEYVGNDRKPTEHVVIFDESQRAWTQAEIASFMARKKGIKGFPWSEPEFLIGTMNRLTDWATIVCLVGGGQEINKGEAGLPEWFKSLKRSFPNWDVYVADKLDDSEYLHGTDWGEMTSGLNITVDNRLHLATSMRSFRSENVSLFIKQILEHDTINAQKTYLKIKDQYPIAITRDLTTAKSWVKSKARGNERYGLLASSNAARLKPRGVYYAKDRSSISPENWFLNESNDIRSSYFFESVASEFETQGLELDYAIVAWDADFRIENGHWVHYHMSNRLRPPNWSKVKNENNIEYLTNAYRVLLTRSRQGFVIYIPEGVDDDITRCNSFYDGTFEYLKSLGIKEI